MNDNPNTHQDTTQEQTATPEAARYDRFVELSRELFDKGQEKGREAWEKAMELARQQLATAGEFSVEQGEKSGTVALRHQAIEGAKSYIWQYCVGETPAADENDWKLGTVTTKASAELTGLTPLTKYWFRVAAVTVDGTGAFSTPLMLTVI